MHVITIAIESIESIVIPSIQDSSSDFESGFNTTIRQVQTLSQASVHGTILDFNVNPCIPQLQVQTQLSQASIQPLILPSSLCVLFQHSSIACEHFHIVDLATLKSKIFLFSNYCVRIMD